MPDYPTDDEFLSQTSEDIFVIAQKLVNFAVAVLLKQENVEQDAIALLATYADLSQIDFPKEVEKKIEACNAHDN